MKFIQFEQQINFYIKNDKIKKALDILESFTSQSDFHNDVILQSGKFQYLQNQVRKGVIDQEWSSIERNKIRNALKEIVEDIKLEMQFKEDQNSKAKKIVKHLDNRYTLLLVSIIGVLLFIFVVIVKDKNGSSELMNREKIVLMDSRLKDLVYNYEGWKQGKTNADEIYEILDDLEGVDIDIENTSLTWSREEQIYQIAPDLIIIHISCFYDKTNADDSEHKFYSFVESISELDTRWIIYSREFHHQNTWKERLVHDFPKLSGKIEILKVKSPMNFSDIVIQRKLKSLVKKLLKI